MNGKTFGKHARNPSIYVLQSNVSVNEIPRKSAVFSALMRKTMVKHAKYLAISRKTFLRLTPSYQTLACTKEFAESVCKNSPRESVYHSVESKP